MDPFLGEIRMFGGNFAPRGWALCDGQLLPISKYSALFSILGTTYGGDGRTTFGLPDLRGRVPVHAGRGPGLSDYRLGKKGGQETVTLTTSEMPSHHHGLVAGSNSSASQASGNLIAAQGQFSTGSPGSAMHQASLQNTGGSQPHTNIQPYLAVHYIIALQGIYPSRS